MNHIVETILYDLPAYIKEDYSRLVEALRVYYTYETQPGGVLHTLWGHNARLDVDQDGLASVVKSLGIDDVPREYARDFLEAQREYFAQQGSRRGVINYMRIFHGLPVHIEDTGKSVLEPSAARRDAYTRTYVRTNEWLSAEAVLTTEQSGAQGDVCSARALNPGDDKIYEILYSPRRPRPVLAGNAEYTGTQGVEVLGEVVITGADGHGHTMGSQWLLRDALGTTYAEISGLKRIALRAIQVVAPGQGYEVSDVIAIRGARGWRGEVAAVDLNGGITAIRCLDMGDGVTRADEFTVTTKAGSGAVLAAGEPLGIPSGFTTPRPLIPPVVTIASNTPGTSQVLNTEILVETRVYEQTGWNGVIGVGSVITDSAVWQHGSYRLSANADPGIWAPGIWRWHHRGGRVAETLESFQSTREAPRLDAVSSVLYPIDIDAGLGEGQSVTTWLDTYIAIRQTIRGGESTEASLDTLITPRADLFAGTVMTVDVATRPRLSLAASAGQSLEVELE